ncbi:polyhydroxyalkanoic acid system family protein [Haliangium ochraceum]|uniref:Uncharacterized protein n=1 Tax=Haliangium ochraceum (strain DSM 14365 / JCM 11303 / SMP-2) TaxID=502025 RepID=D0LU61_HALO1|nr:polyhydroxyalkanoic acid system family protein [Haliangium ochraceum]ACY17425.1 conserved hypothetical protein [Haliangium ochraceum DSM 14365]
MDFDYKHDLPVDDARARLEALGEYLNSKHGINVTWSGETAKFQGKYMVVSIDGEMTLKPDKVSVKAKDPGMLWRKKAKEYLQGKLAQYLDPKTPVDALRGNK